ncbi:MAG: DUF4340 domain-containing protein [Xanthomonadales bacterium]|nr:DUF4340 domain-containing protein [Xanthomonadales bacterium]
MNRKPFLMLAALTAVAVVLTVMMDREGREDEPAGQKFIPGLAEQVNDVTSLVHRSAGETIATLSRGDSNWTVGELDGYPADWQRVRATLSALAEATIVEFKTANPDYFERLGVEDPGASGSQAAVLDVGTGEQAWSIIAGDIPDLQFGQYVRRADAGQVVLIDQEFDLPDETIDWADRQLLDLGAGLVASVSIMHADGEVVTLSKASADDSDFSLKTLPEGRELQSVYTLNSAAGMFSMLEIDDVQRDEIEAANVLAESTVTLFNGARVNAEVLTVEAVQDDSAAGESEVTRWVRISTDLVDPDLAEEQAMEQVEGIRQRTEGWLYQVSSTRMDNLLRRNENFLKPLDDQ